MGKKMNSILLSLFLVFAFVLSGCSVETNIRSFGVFCGNEGNDGNDGSDGSGRCNYSE